MLALGIYSLTASVITVPARISHNTERGMVGMIIIKIRSQFVFTVNLLHHNLERIEL